MDVEIDRKERDLVQLCLAHVPHVQAIYLFGSWATAEASVSSDVDIALLLPVREAKALGILYTTALHHALERRFSKDVDLINLRLVSTVFQKEVVDAERRIYCADTYVADEFEMLVMSYYQKLNEERAGILQSFYETKRAVQI